MSMQQLRALKRRIPKKGVVRFWLDSGTRVMVGVVVRTAKTNAPLRRQYTGIIAPPDFRREPHVLLKDPDYGMRFAHWIPLERLYLTKKEADEVAYGAMKLQYAARLGSAVDPIN